MKKRERKTPTGEQTSIRGGHLFFEDAFQCEVDTEIFTSIIEDKTVRSIRVVSLSNSWYQNVYLGNETFIREDINVQMTIRKETRSGRDYWYAYRQIAGCLHKKYVGNSLSITQEKLLKIAQVLPGW